VGSATNPLGLRSATAPRRGPWGRIRADGCPSLGGWRCLHESAPSGDGGPPAGSAISAPRRGMQDQRSRRDTPSTETDRDRTPPSAIDLHSIPRERSSRSSSLLSGARGAPGPGLRDPGPGARSGRGSAVGVELALRLDDPIVRFHRARGAPGGVHDRGKTLPWTRPSIEVVHLVERRILRTPSR
jgi:hypothetical protein